MENTPEQDRSDEVTVRETSDRTVIGVWDTFGEHSSAAIGAEQERALIEDLDATPNDELRNFIEEKRDVYEEFSPRGANAHGVLDKLQELVSDD